MCGLDIYTYSFKKTSMAVIMKTKSTVSIESKKVHIDSELLFQRLSAVYNIDELSTAFGFELSTSPMSLFDKK